MTYSRPDTTFPFCFPGWGTRTRGGSGILVSRALVSGGEAHLCTAAWTRCRRAVQSLPPLKPTQSWVSLYRARAVSMVCRAPATFFPREDPAGQVGKRPLPIPCDTYGRQRVVATMMPLLKTLQYFPSVSRIKSRFLHAAYEAGRSAPCLPFSRMASQRLPLRDPGFFPLS